MENVSFSGKLQELPGHLYAFRVIVPYNLVAHFVENKQTRMIVTYENRITTHQALMPFGEDRYLMINKDLRKKLGLKEGAEVEIQLEADLSTYGMPMPKELEACLFDDPLAQERFDALTPGKQRNLIHIVDRVKSTDSRIAKALAIAAHLNEQKEGVDFKRLNERIKEFNKRNARH